MSENQSWHYLQSPVKSSLQRNFHVSTKKTEFFKGKVQSKKNREKQVGSTFDGRNAVAFVLITLLPR